jgi:hypothetical protein
VTPVEIVILIAIGFTAGVSNALVGGGTLFSFPVLLAVGMPPVAAITTNMTALWPGLVTSAYAYLPELKRVREYLSLRVVVTFCGGMVGGLLLLASGDALFSALVPWLLATGTVLFAFSRPIVRHVLHVSHERRNIALLLVLEFFCAIYGGYFGAGIGILLLAALALAGEHDMQSANAQRNFLVCFINVIAIGLFISAGTVDWTVALIVMAGSIAGGYSGARLAKHIPNQWLRHLITAAGAIFSVIYFIRLYG